MYTYKCNTVRVIDGNTIDAVIDLGFNVTIRQRIKLYGVNVSDIRSSDEEQRNKAVDSKNKLAELVGTEFICETMLNKRGKAGRIMGNLTKVHPDRSISDINKQLIDSGFAEQFSATGE